MSALNPVMKIRRQLEEILKIHNYKCKISYAEKIRSTLAMMNIGRGFARIYTNATTILVNDELFIWIGSGKIFGEIPVQLLFMVVVVIITGLILNKKASRNCNH